MSGKFSQPKVIITAVLIAVVAFAAMAPVAVKAFSKDGSAVNFIARLFAGRDELSQAVPAASAIEPAEDNRVELSPAANTSLEPFAASFDDSPEVEQAESSESESSSHEAEPAGYFELVGTLFANDGEQWDVSGITVVVSPTTELKGTLEVGMLVKVEGTLQADGSVLAREIKPALTGADPENNGNVDPGNPHDGDDESELIGTLTAMVDESTWTLNGVITIILDENTELESGITVGEMIKVEGALQEDGSILARQIKRFAFEKMNGKTAFGESEIVGKLDEMIDENTWTVSGITVMLNDQTEREGSFEVGVTVKVEGMFQADGSILAREVKVVTATGESPEKVKEHQGEFELVGKLTVMDGTTWTVDGVSIIVSAATELKGKLEVGMTVKVEGTLNDDGSVDAREIKPANDNDRSGSENEDDDDDHKGPGNGQGGGDDDDSDDDRSGSGGGDHHDDDGHSGSGGGDDHGGSGGGHHGGGDD